MEYKFEEFSNVIIDPIITINEIIIVNRSNNTFNVTVLFMPTKQAIDIQLPFTGFENIESQVYAYLVDFEYNGEIWHEDTNFQIKFTEKQLRYLFLEVPAMVMDFKSLEDYEDMMGNIYFYVNELSDEDRQLIENFGGIITERRAE